MKPLIDNKRAYFNYEILETFDGGIELFGHEVKALKAGKGSLAGSYIIVRGNEVFLVGADIAPYQPKNTPQEYDSKRNRKLLLTKKEISKLVGIEKEKGLTIIPLSLYNKGRYLKISLGIGRGKKILDKRETIKKREADIEMRRAKHSRRQ